MTSKNIKFYKTSTEPLKAESESIWFDSTSKKIKLKENDKFVLYGAGGGFVDDPLILEINTLFIYFVCMQDVDITSDKDFLKLNNINPETSNWLFKTQDGSTDANVILNAIDSAYQNNKRIFIKITNKQHWGSGTYYDRAINSLIECSITKDNMKESNESGSDTTEYSIFKISFDVSEYLYERNPNSSIIITIDTHNFDNGPTFNGITPYLHPIMTTKYVREDVYHGDFLRIDSPGNFSGIYLPFFYKGHMPNEYDTKSVVWTGYTTKKYIKEQLDLIQLTWTQYD